MIWNCQLQEIIDGFAENEKAAVCVICGSRFERGRIYQMEENLYDAHGAVQKHFEIEHGNMAAYLLKQDVNLTGITEVQKQILNLILEGKSDKDISAEMKIAPSTVRNHRFKFREKEKQAKMFLALMESLASKTRSRIEKSDMGVIEEIHETATMVDDRYNITEKEREKTLETYLDKDGKLKQIPAKAKKKIIVLREIMKNFKKEKSYSEQEVNKILKAIYEEDYPSIRRALIEYGFMYRTADGKVYCVRK